MYGYDCFEKQQYLHYQPLKNINIISIQYNYEGLYYYTFCFIIYSKLTTHYWIFIYTEYTKKQSNKS